MNEHCIIKNITTEEELDRALAFDKKVFDIPSDGQSSAYSRMNWLIRMKTHADLLLYAQSYGEVVGIVFGRVENAKSITVGPVAVDERFRRQGIAREMMLLLEKRAQGHGIHNLVLGSVENAEGFTEKWAIKEYCFCSRKSTRRMSCFR